MKEIKFQFNIDDSVKVDKNGFSGIIVMCAIQGDPENPEKVYYIQGSSDSGWYPERLIVEAK